MKLHIVSKRSHDIALDDLLNTAPVDWRKKVEALHLDDLGECISGLDAIIEKSASLRGYLDGRYGHGGGDQGHTEAVQSSNRLVTKIRRALGYTFDKVDFHF